MVLLKLNSCLCWHTAIYQTSVRFLRSGYRLKPGIATAKLDSNKSEEEKFKEKVRESMLHKRRSPLRGFERINTTQLEQKKYANVLPNAPYYGRDDLPTYGSYKNYVKEAERARRRLRKKKVFWKTVNFWWKEQIDEPDYVDIGLPLPSLKQTLKEKRALKRELKRIKSDPERERTARNRTLKIDVDSFLEEWESSTTGAKDLHEVAMHYNVYRDLFGDKHFYPLVRMDVGYESADELVNPVYHGNELSPVEASNPPLVSIAGADDDLWTLILTNPDGNLEDGEAECLHWSIGNIKGSDISSGETLVDYLQPLPMRGTGYHRLVFVLFKQKQCIDFKDEKKDLPCLLLRERSFRTEYFYNKFQEHLTPVSLKFFQSKWDSTVQETFQHRLDMAEPVYKFIPTDVDRVGQLKNVPHRKTLTWLKRFMPKEPIYPGGGAFS